MRNESEEGDLDDKREFSFDDEDLLEETKKSFFGKNKSNEDSEGEPNFDFIFGNDDEKDLDLGLDDPKDGLGGSSKNSSRYGILEEARERDLWNLTKDERISIEEPDDGGRVMSMKGGLGSVKDLLVDGVGDVMGRIREMGNQFLDSNNSEEDEKGLDEEENARGHILSGRSGRNQYLANNAKSNLSDFIPLDEIVRGMNRENMGPSISPREARELGETYLWGVNRAIGSEFEDLVSEYLSDVDGLLGADQYEIQQRVETGGVYENGNQRYVIPDMMLLRNGEPTNLLEMKVGLRGLKLKDVEYVADHFPEAAIKFIFLRSSKDKVEEYEALGGLVDEYLDRNEITGNAHLNEKAVLLSRMEVWNMDDVKELLPKRVHEEFFARADRISELSIHQNEDYVAAYNSLNKLRELTDELKGLVRNSVDQGSGHDSELIERSIDGAVIDGETYRSYINMAILQKVIVEGSLPSGDLYEYLGMSGNHVLKYSNPMVEAGIIQYTEIVPGTTFLYFRDADRPIYFNTLTSGTKAGFELMQREGILPEGEVTFHVAAEVLGSRPQRKATVFNFFNQKEIIGEVDIANLVKESHFNSVQMADEAMKWMYNRGMIDRDHLPWDSRYYYYWLKSKEKPEFNEIRKFMDEKMLHSVEFIEKMAKYRFDNFNDFRKYFSIANSNTSLEKSWREGLKILRISEELQNIGNLNVDEIRKFCNKTTDSNIPSKTIEGGLEILVTAKILSKTNNEYTLNKELSSEDIVSKINSFERVKTLNYSNSNFQLDTSLKQAKPYALDKLKELGFEREEIIELKGYGQKIYYLVQNGDIDIFHASSLKTLLPEYKERSISMGLRKLAKMDLLDRFRVPKNLINTRHGITYYKLKGQLEASFSDLKDLLDTDIKSLISNLQDITSSDVWDMCAGDFRTNLQDRSFDHSSWLPALQVYVVGYNLAVNTDESHGVVSVDQLDQKVKEIGIFKSSNHIRNRGELTGALNRLSMSKLDEIKIRKINSLLYEFNLQ